MDFNVPLSENYEILDTTRIDESLPTLRKIISDGGIPVIMSHLGRPKGGYEERYSLKHVFPYLTDSLNAPGIFSPDCIDEKALDSVRQCPAGGFVLLENLRFHKEEEKGDLGFATALSELGDFYVNDAFGAAHRAHASTSVVAQFFKGRCSFGFLVEKELEALDKILNNPQRPFIAILGGAKVSDKLGVIRRLLDVADTLLVGGAMAFTFIKAQGGNIGSSLVELDKINLCLNLLNEAQLKGKRILLPSDVKASTSLDNEINTAFYPSNNIPEGWMGLDIGTNTIAEYLDVIKNASTILWNGPMGVFEKPVFRFGTEEIARGIAAASRYGTYSVVGGGDSLSALSLLGLKNEVSYVCTGGGAMLEYVEGKKLPGIEAVRQFA